MWNPNPMSLWIWSDGPGVAGAAEEPPAAAAGFVDECGVARPAVHGVVFAVTHSPTCPPRHFFFRALAWLFGPFVRAGARTAYAR